MCESKAVVIKNGSEEVLLDDVVLLNVREDGSIVLINIEGRELVVKELKLDRIDFIKHRIYFKPR